MTYPCPECGKVTRVIQTLGTTRRRMCIECPHRFETTEVLLAAGGSAGQTVTSTIAPKGVVLSLSQEFLSWEAQLWAHLQKQGSTTRKKFDDARGTRLAAYNLAKDEGTLWQPPTTQDLDFDKALE